MGIPVYLVFLIVISGIAGFILCIIFWYWVYYTWKIIKSALEIYIIKNKESARKIMETSEIKKYMNSHNRKRYLTSKIIYYPKNNSPSEGPIVYR